MENESRAGPNRRSRCRRCSTTQVGYERRSMTEKLRMASTIGFCTTAKNAEALHKFERDLATTSSTKGSVIDSVSIAGANDQRCWKSASSSTNSQYTRGRIPVYITGATAGVSDRYVVNAKRAILQRREVFRTIQAFGTRQTVGVNTTCLRLETTFRLMMASSFARRGPGLWTSSVRT